MISTGKVHGGAVRHIARKGEADKSLCGRWVLMITANRGTERMCKTCARISGSEVITVTEAVHPDDRDAVHVLETVAASVSERHAMRVRALPGTVKRINAEWFATMRVMLTANAKRRPVNVLADLEKSRDWAFATLVINAANRGEIITGKVEKAKPVEFLMNTAPTESDEIVNGSPVMPTAQRGGGDGMVNPNSTSKARGTFGGSEKQMNLINSLIGQIDEINAEIYPNIDALATRYTPEYLSSLTRQTQVRKEIDGLFEMLNILKRKRNEKNAEIRKAETKANPAEDGFYVMGDTFVTVKWNRAHTGQYATVWSHESESWEYDGRKSSAILADIKAGKLSRVTEEDAARFGELYGRCMRCSRTLTDPTSILESMGKVCRGKMGF